MEPFPETIRALVSREWDSTKTLGITPTFLSEYGHGDNEADMSHPLRHNDFNTKDDQATVISREGGSIQTSGNNQTVHLRDTVIIDIFGTGWQRLIFSTEVNRIIFAHQPNAAHPLPKSDNVQDSAILYFVQDHIDWIKIGEIRDADIVGQLSGELDCVWERQLSP